MIITFNDVINKARAAVSEKSISYEDLSNDTYHSEAARLFRWVSNNVRGMTPLYRFTPQKSFDREHAQTLSNAGELLDQANRYLEEKVRRVVPGFTAGMLETPTAVDAPDGVNFTEFHGGMLEFIIKKVTDCPALLNEIPLHEFMALDAATCAYHHARKREPCSFWRLEETKSALHS